MLKDNLLIDVNDGSDYIDGLKIKANNLDELRQIRQLIIDAKNPYKYISLDTITDIEELSLELALDLYRQTPMGRAFGLDPKTNEYKYKDIRTLPNGGGYLYIRLAFEKIVNSFKGLSEYLILVGHTKDKNINKNGKELSENSIDLSGKLSNIVAAKADAIGYVYREKNLNIVSFEGGEDSIVEARPKHLRNQKIVLGESDENGNLKAYWDRIYKD